MIYVDHTSRFERNTGIQRCVRSLARAWQELGVRLQPVIWNRNLNSLEPASLAQRRHLARWNGPHLEQWADSSCATSKVLLNAKWLIVIELVSGPHNPTTEELLEMASSKNLSLAWLFHDAIPLMHSNLYGSFSQSASLSHAQYMKGLASFDLVLANSRTTAIHLQNFWIKEKLVPKARLLALPLAEEFSGTSRLPPPKGDGGIVLCVSSLEPRKNHVALLKAFADLCAQGCWPSGLALVLVGWPNDSRVVSLVKRAISLGLPLLWEQKADDKTLLDLYRQACFCVFPSLEEGFGLPVAESLWHHRVCICSNKGALAELAASGGCLTVDTANWKDLRDGLRTLISSYPLRKELQLAIQQRPIKLWKDVAKSWLKLIKTGEYI